MLEFFNDGGWPMYPIALTGLVLLYASGRYAFDREPARLRFVATLSLALLIAAVQGFVCDVAKVLGFWAHWAEKGFPYPPPIMTQVALLGAKESSCTLIFGLGLWGLALVLVAIGLYRNGWRELQAARS